MYGSLDGDNISKVSHNSKTFPLPLYLLLKILHFKNPFLQVKKNTTCLNDGKMKEAENPHINLWKAKKTKRQVCGGFYKKEATQLFEETYLLIFQATLLRNPKYKYNTFKQ